MKLSEIQDVCTSQRSTLENQEYGTERELLSKIPDIQSHALVIKGVRRCGKSTLLRQFVKKLNKPFFYLNFEDLRLASFNHSDFSLIDTVISDSGAKFIFFDEIQSADRWELYIRQKLDEGFQLAITGSNASLLSKEFGTSLTGRHISKELFPFSYMEFCSFFGVEKSAKSFMNYLEKGGFPEYLKTKNADILVQLQSDILFRDIAVRYKIRDAASLKRLFVYLISNPAQLFSPSKLTNIAGVKSPTTLLEYISFFEAAYLLHLLPCFSWSVKSQNLAPKKAYIIDSGIIKTGSFSFSENYGAILENYVFNYLRTKIEVPEFLADSEIFYFIGKSGAECDFILAPQKKPSCIQVCWDLNTNNQDREINGLLEAMDFFNLNTGTILTYNTEDIIQISGKKIMVIPVWNY